jgi:hypothetical protein
MRSGETVAENQKRLVTHFMVWATSRCCRCTTAGFSAGLAGIPFCQNQAPGLTVYPIEIFGGYAARDHGHQPVGQAA